ncbi:MAG: FxsA family protein [Hyphomicrobiaceae bacterium]|nr:FxsA family protein [Hyphomicrobiaceae bacterium]
MLRLAVGLAFIVVPMLELVLLLKIGQAIGVWPTVALVITTALTGAYIISRQSLRVVSRALEALSEGRVPVEPVLDGLFLLVAGALLLTPGLATDVVALVLLVPPARRAIARASMRWLLRRTRVRVKRYTDAGRENWEEPRPRDQGPPGRGRNGPVIDVDYERMDNKPADRQEPR